MQKEDGLDAEDREFFSTVIQIISANPFGDERDTLENSLVPGLGHDRLRRVKKFHGLLHDRVTRLEHRGLRTIQQFSGDDRRLMNYAFLFHVYIPFESQLESVILEQLQRPDAVVTLPFAEHLIARIKPHGFSDKQCLRYLGLYYQLRRAFHFIEDSLVGDSPSMKQLRCSLWNNVFTKDIRNYDEHLWNRMEDFSTLLLGETGTGKGSAAAAIGRSGYIPFDRKKGCFIESFAETFIATNLSQFPESLIESELFGHRKGAFTGAIDSHKGLFERCSVHGSLFLDEIGDVSVPTQLKLLQILQERTFTPVGSHTRQRFSGRVIAATNRSLQELREQGKIRDDFFYRLCSDVITVPPLRQRIEESPTELDLLLDLLVTRLTGKNDPSLIDMVLESLKRTLPAGYPWPGNVRELEQAVRRVILNGSYQGETTQVGLSAEGKICERMRSGTMTARELLRHYCSTLYDQLGTYEEVARRTGLDRRTVKRYVVD